MVFTAFCFAVAVAFIFMAYCLGHANGRLTALDQCLDMMEKED